jgi:hypothetical protein
LSRLSSFYQSNQQEVTNDGIEVVNDDDLNSEDESDDDDNDDQSV